MELLMGLRSGGNVRLIRKSSGNAAPLDSSEGKDNVIPGGLALLKSKDDVRRIRRNLPQYFAEQLDHIGIEIKDIDREHLLQGFEKVAPRVAGDRTLYYDLTPEDEGLRIRWQNLIQTNGGLWEKSVDHFRTENPCLCAERRATDAVGAVPIYSISYCGSQNVGLDLVFDPNREGFELVNNWSSPGAQAERDIFLQSRVVELLLDLLLEIQDHPERLKSKLEDLPGSVD
jgi:hypothetical protein